MNDDIHDLSGAFALDALDDIERARFHNHLERCLTCQRDVSDFRAAATQLGMSAAEQPPAALRSNVLAAITEVRQESPLERAVAHRRPPRWMAVVAAAAAAVLIAVLGVQLMSARDARRQADALSEILTARDAEVLELEGDVGTGRVVWSRSEARSVLVLDGLPELPEGRAYQLWFVVGEEQIPAGVFQQTGDRVVATGGDMPEGLQAIGITEEDARGAAVPTGPMLLIVDVPPGTV